MRCRFIHGKMLHFGSSLIWSKRLHLHQGEEMRSSRLHLYTLIRMDVLLSNRSCSKAHVDKKGETNRRWKNIGGTQLSDRRLLECCHSLEQTCVDRCRWPYIVYLKRQALGAQNDRSVVGLNICAA